MFEPHARASSRKSQHKKSNATSSQQRAAPRTMRRHVSGPFTPPRRASSGSYPEPRAGARRAPTSSSDDAGAAVKASVGGGSSDLEEDGDERTPADASEDDDARASLRDVDIGAREEPGERVRVLDDERADANSETDAHEDCEDCEDHARGEDDNLLDGDEEEREEEREEEGSASDGGDSLADHSSADDASLNELDPDNLRVLQSYGLRPQMSYESSENDTGSDDNLLDDDDDNLLDDGHEATGSAPSTPLPPTWRAAISASLRLSRRLGESAEFLRVAAGRTSDDDDDDDDESSSEEEDDDEDDDDVTFSPSVHDDELNASTRAAADEMLRAGDVSHEVASLFAARVPRGVATSWEDARRGIDLDAVCVERFGGGESVDRAGPSTRAFEPPCDRSFGFFGFDDGDRFESGSKAFGREGPEGTTTSRRKSDDATCIAEAVASSTAFCPRKPRARAARALADVPFVADLLEKLPGVDPSDERILSVLAAVTVDGSCEDERGKSGDGRRRRRGNRAVSAVSAVSGSFPRASAPASGRGLGAMARRELAGGGLPGRDRRRGGRGDERRDARVAGRT